MLMPLIHIYIHPILISIYGDHSFQIYSNSFSSYWYYVLFVTVEESPLWESCLKLQRSGKVQILPQLLDGECLSVVLIILHLVFFKPTVASVHQEL